jgi:hypothetical protein
VVGRISFESGTFILRPLNSPAIIRIFISGIIRIIPQF